MKFKSYSSYSEFQYAVRMRHRYVYDNDINKFLKAVIETSKKRIIQISANSLLYRAQRGCDFQPVYDGDEQVADTDYPYSKERMIPIREKTREGRANPRGMVYLYLASNPDTACAEVRPWLNYPISLGTFRTKRELNVVDCRSDGLRIHIYLKEPGPAKREKCVWDDINIAFSTPVNPEDPETEYVPTQIIAECLSKAGHDGIIYKSSYDAGYNIVLFDCDSVEIVNCRLSKLKIIKFEFEHEKMGYNIRPK